MENRNIVFGWFCLFHTKGSTLEPKTNQLFISYGMTVKISYLERKGISCIFLLLLRKVWRNVYGISLGYSKLRASQL